MPKYQPHELNPQPCWDKPAGSGYMKDKWVLASASRTIPCSWNCWMEKDYIPVKTAAFKQAARLLFGGS